MFQLSCQGKAQIHPDEGQGRKNRWEEYPKAGKSGSSMERGSQEGLGGLGCFPETVGSHGRLLRRENIGGFLL